MSLDPIKKSDYTNDGDDQQKNNPKEFFNLETFNEAIEQAKQLPIPKKLFSGFWYEQEVCFFFAASGVGKSVLAFQIADSISKGKAIEGFELEVEPKKVLYLDYELSVKQVEKRCSENYLNHYKFSDNLYRLTPNVTHELPKGTSEMEYSLLGIEQIVKETGAKVIIIDNITYLSGGNMEKGHEARDFIKKLLMLKRTLGLSILVMAHTPKRASSYCVISQNDLHGSKMLINLCDSAFALGLSAQDKDLRYVKQIKVRSAEKEFGQNNVQIIEMNGTGNFLHFDYVGSAREKEHLQETTLETVKSLEEQIIDMHKQNMSMQSITKQLDTYYSKVRRTIKRYEKNVGEKKKKDKDWKDFIDGLDDDK